MNLFAHAYLAYRVDVEERFVFGSMLPDLENMLNSRFDEVRCNHIRKGREHHQQVDSVFHAHPLFITHYAQSAQQLREAGWPNGSARACAHLAIEWNIDHALLNQETAGNFFQQALKFGQGMQAVEALGIEFPPLASSLSVLCNRLEEFATDLDKDACVQIADSIVRALAHRPRLRVPEDKRAFMAEEMAVISQRLQPDIAQIVFETEQNMLSLPPESLDKESYDERAERRQRS